MTLVSSVTDSNIVLTMLECRYAECRVLSIVMLNAVILNVIILSVVVPERNSVQGILKGKVSLYC
jgi:hypothetical protein